MALVPDSKQGKVNFYQSKIAPWTTNATAIGTTTSAVTALDTLVTAAADALAAQTVAEAAWRSSVETSDLAVAAMATAGANIISAIRTKARTAGDSVYTLAQIPAPATPSPRGAPGQPTDFAVSLGADGALTLTWKCPNPAGSTGTLYQVYRKVEDETEYTYLGGSGQRLFVDSTLPQGTSQAMYQIQAVRSTAVGPWATFVVTIGTVAGGGMAASVAAASPKLAA